MSGPSNRKPATILVIDDDPSVLSVVQALLHSRGHTVLPARGGERALDVFQEHQSAIDLIIADVVMPGMSGPEVVEKLLLSRSNLPVLFISGSSGDSRVRELVDNKAVSFLAKPFTIRDLETAVLTVLKQRVPTAAA